MLRSAGRGFQLLALVLVAAALPVGLVYDAVRTEVAMLAVGGGLFLLGRLMAESGSGG